MPAFGAGNEGSNPSGAISMVQEWTIYDTRDDELTFVKASTHKEAIRKGCRRNVVPQRTHDARPRTGDAVLMDRFEFREFMESLAQS